MRFKHSLRHSAGYDADLGCFIDSNLNCKGGGTSTTTTAPSPQQEAILGKQLDIANQLEQQGQLRFFPGQTLADESQFSQLGQLSQLGAAPGLQQFAGLQQRTLSGLLDPTSAANQAAIAPLIGNLENRLLPQIGTQATRQGAFGGSRQFVQEAEAIGDVSGRVTDAILRNQLGALQLAPQVAQQQLLPGQVLGGVGAQQEERSQAEIDAARERFEFQEFAPTDLANRINPLLGGLDFGSITSSRTSGGK